MIYYLIVTLIFCVLLAIFDVKKRLLPNNFLLIYFVFQLCILIPNDKANYVSFVMVSFGGLFLYIFKFIAAGDVKLASIMSIAIAPDHLDVCLLVMVGIGGGQAVYYILKHYWCLYHYGKSDAIERGVPYGLAICVGFYIGTLLSLS